MLTVNTALTRDRKHLGALLNTLGLVGKGVEVGSHRGEFARTILESWQGQCLFCVDPWEPNYDPSDPAAIGDRMVDYKYCLQVREEFGADRVQIVRQRSLEAAVAFEDASLDFVYIDANHQYPHPLHDLQVWWPKIRSGGLIAGHDIICPGEATPWEGVQQAVFEFAKQVSRTIYLIPETLAMPWSFYLIK